MRKILSLMLFVVTLFAFGCGRSSPEVQSISGVKMATVGTVPTDAKGHTVEQSNLLHRYERDNKVGSTCHLYVISPFTGQVILYSAVKGKPTSSGKRLTPRKITGMGVNQSSTNVGLPEFTVGNVRYTTDELPNEDGTYGSSTEYLYWFTPDDAYHQHILNGSDIVHISDRPLVVKDIVIRVESGPAK